jgi:hypothetical protein
MALMLVIAACARGKSTEARPIAWSAPLEIAAGGGEKGPWQQNNSRFDYVDDPSVALEPSGAANVVWVDQRVKDIFFQTYERDGSPRLAKPVNVSRSKDVFSWLPRIARSPVEPRHVYVLWQEIVFSGGTHGGEIFFARSTDDGASFEPPVNLSRSINGDGKGRIDPKRWHNGSLDLAVAPDGALHAAWTEYDGPLWLAHSTDRGRSFSAPLLVDAGTPHPARGPALAAAGDLVYLAWTVGEDDGADVRVATSSDRGATFGTPVVVERTRGYSDAPKLALAGGTLHVVYADSAGGPFALANVRYTRSRDGVMFEPPRTISAPHRGASFPSLALDGARVFVAWELHRDADDLPRGLGLAFSLDGGTTFATPVIVEGSSDRGSNGSQQGRLMRKLAVRDGRIAIVNSALRHGEGSRVWLVRGSVRGE